MLKIQIIMLVKAFDIHRNVSLDSEQWQWQWQCNDLRKKNHSLLQFAITVSDT